MIDTNTVLVSGAIVFREGRGKRYWFISKKADEEDEWELPKTFVRKVESSVRAALRMMGEQGGMSTKVLEEAGRAGGVTTINGKTLPKRDIFYLMIVLSKEGEAIGFEGFKWLEYAKAIRKLSSKREQIMLRQARKELFKWKREEKKKQA
jgi:ADP-ribose pyrophosphatase YjhB (NUDIX family)